MVTQPRWAKAGFLVRRKRAPQAKLPPSERSEGQQVAARERRTRKARRGPGPSAAMAIRGRTAGPRMGPRPRAGPGPREGRPLRAVPDYGQPQPRGESVSGAKTHRLSREALNRRPRCGPRGPQERWSCWRRYAPTCAGQRVPSHGSAASKRLPGRDPASTPTAVRLRRELPRAQARRPQRAVVSTCGSTGGPPSRIAGGLRPNKKRERFLVRPAGRRP